jgi:hypothetical protein
MSADFGVIFVRKGINLIKELLVTLPHNNRYLSLGV